MAMRALTVTLTTDLIEGLKEFANSRGLTVSEVVQFQMTNFLRRAPQVLGLSDKMPFGKFVGYKIENIVRNEPNYARWMLENITSIRFRDEVYELYYALDMIDQNRVEVDEYGVVVSAG